MTKPYVLIVWNDAHGSGDTVDEAAMRHQPMVFFSPGWLLRSDDTGVSIAVEWCETDNTFRGHTFVPRALVIEERPLVTPKRHRVRKTKPA